MKPRTLPFHIVFAFLMTMACESTLDVTCTDIGCHGGLNILVTGGPVDTPITVTARAGTVASVAITCPAADGTCDVFMDDWFPPTATIEVSWAAESRSFTVDPVYEMVQPNGPNCPPICDVALVELTL